MPTRKKVVNWLFDVYNQLTFDMSHIKYMYENVIQMMV